MRANSKTRPPDVRIENLGETSDVILVENVETILSTKAEISETNESYRYDEYRINVVSRDNLLESITNEVKMWLAFAKKATLVVANDTERIGKLEDTQSKVIDTLAVALGVIL